MALIIFAENIKENKSILQEAYVIKCESRRVTVGRQAQTVSPQPTQVSDEEVLVSLLADLQERHDVEAEQYIQNLCNQVSKRGETGGGGEWERAGAAEGVGIGEGRGKWQVRKGKGGSVGRR